MGVAGLRDAFNSVASPRYTCGMAFLDTERDTAGKEWSRLRFHGTGADGAKFEVASERVMPGEDVISATKVTAHKLMETKP